MAVTFLEPGGDADFVTPTTTNGFWGSTSGVSLDTVIVHGGHQKSIKYSTAEYGGNCNTPAGVVSDAGGRISFWLYVNNPTPNQSSFAANVIWFYQSNGTTPVFALRLNPIPGTLFLQNVNNAIGTATTPIPYNQWIRISVAYTITSTSVNSFNVYVNGALNISVTNGSLSNLTTSVVSFGAGGQLDIRTSEHYVDNQNTLDDPGNIWVTAKRAYANGTINGFTTEIGAGGSGYGSGHAQQVNERPLNTANGWSMVGAGSAVTEEYNIEGKSVGDIDVSAAAIIEWMAWASVSSLAGETISLIFNGSTVSQAITSTITLYKKIAGSNIYPAGTGADVGIITDTSLTTVSLYECGILVAFVPPAQAINNSANNLLAGRIEVH